MALLKAIPVCTFILAMSSCRLLDNPTVPEGTMSPTMYLTKAGGLGLANRAEGLLSSSLKQSVFMGGLMSDELNASNVGAMVPIDERHTPESPPSSNQRGAGDVFYADLHRARNQAQFARAVLYKYAGDIHPAVLGRLMALEGYSVIYLADNFCSGVPLSRLDFQGDYTYTRSLTIEEMYHSAVLLFDSAILISHDSVSVVTLAKLGKARALAGQGKLKEAHEVVQDVSTRDAIHVKLSFAGESGSFSSYGSVSDREGGNGLPFISTLDPRLKIDTVTVNELLIQFPFKYSPVDSFVFPIASGIEARLIEAEYHLNTNDVTRMLSILNALRTDSTYDNIIVKPDGTLDTLWNAGTAGISGLPPLAIPHSIDAALELLFNERAYWLYLSGNRLADLRRLIRIYSRNQYDVFPSGPYLANNKSTFGEYQSNVNLPIPGRERVNPNFHGCLNRDQ